MTFMHVLILTLVVSTAIGVVTSLILRKLGAQPYGYLAGGVGLGLGLALILFLSLKPWSFVDNYELGYIYDSRTGEVIVLQRTGYVSRIPLFQNVHTVDLRPRQVCINVGASNQAGGGGANSRVLNCKLVKFDPKGLDTFIQWHGRDDYSGTTLDDLLKIYAYDGSGRSYPFLNVLRELKNDDAVNGGTVVTGATTPVPATTPSTK